MTERRFPDGFTWGTATAAHQIEGGNWNNDWWRWEHTPGSGCKEPSGDCCDSYHRYDEDNRLIAGLGFGSYRFSLEWSRIEPEEGEFSNAALDHYRRVCASCIEHGITPVVTYHHFTTPRWLADLGGWEDPKTADRFARFAERCTRHLGDLARTVCTINEPNMVATIGYLQGVFPPGVRDRARRHAVNAVFVDAHRKAMDAIKSVDAGIEAGLTVALQDNQAVEGGEAKRDQVRRGLEDVFLEACVGDDFVGVQTYTRARFGPDGALPPEEGVRRTLMGYEFWPEALEACIRRAWEMTEQTPVVVTENGIAVEDDSERVEYVTRALEGVLRCIEDGIEVRGYTYWSALDNFEWALGYGPRFGLIDVDRTTFERTPKPSAEWLGRVARANSLDV